MGLHLDRFDRTEYFSQYQCFICAKLIYSSEMYPQLSVA